MGHCEWIGMAVVRRSCVHRDGGDVDCARGQSWKDRVFVTGVGC